MVHKSLRICEPCRLGEEVSFLLSDDKYRARSYSHNSFGGAAEQKMLNSGVSVGCDHNQLDLLLFRNLYDFLVRSALAS
jgi:hypothetical protein